MSHAITCSKSKLLPRRPSISFTTCIATTGASVPEHAVAIRRLRISPREIASAIAETPSAPRPSERRADRHERENRCGGGRARAVKERLLRSPSIAGDVGRRRPALSPLPNGTVGERTTPLRYARARMAETSGKGTSDGTGAANVEGCDRASDAVASTSGTSRAARERELVAFMKDMAKRADAQKRELDDARRELDDVLDALAAAEFERETFENELKHAMKIEREALEFSILHENAARMKERERVVELETVLAERDTQIQTLTAAAASIVGVIITTT